MRTLNVLDSQKLMERYGIKFAQYGVAKTVEQAMIVASNMGYPVALKVISDDISHKTDVGGVVVDVSSDSQLEASFRKMMASIKKKAPRARVKGVMVQKMVNGGAGILVGGKKDPEFGPVIAFGLGGIFVEVMEDVSFRVVPISKKDAMEMMAETKGFKILDGYRGKSYDLDALATLLVKVSTMLEKRGDIVEMDINPVIALRKGAVAVDARIVLES